LCGVEATTRENFIEESRLPSLALKLLYRGNAEIRSDVANSMRRLIKVVDESGWE
jgi:hypothetical protein